MENSTTDAGRGARWRRTERVDILVEQNLGLATRVARRYAGRGELFDDLVQVARVGLVTAARRYDERRGTPFPAYAVATINGEIKTHLRDHCWSLHVPRPAKERALAVNAAIRHERERSGSDPCPAELARRLQLRECDILDALQARAAFGTQSLDAPISHRGEVESLLLSEVIGSDDSGYERVEEWLTLRTTIRGLREIERQIVYLRYVEHHTQREIASLVGVSQMQVSRALRSVRQRLGYEGGRSHEGDRKLRPRARTRSAPAHR